MNEENTSIDAKKVPSQSEKKLLKLIEDIDVMASFASTSGKSIPEDIARLLAELNVLKDRGYFSTNEKVDVEKFSHNYISAIKVHNQLVKIVSPATPESIKATERIGNSFRIKNSATNILVYSTLICLAIFVATAMPIKISENLSEITRSLNLLFAAGLGAGFYSLSTSRQYIRDRTYNPSYNQIYYVRFVLGLAAGTILGHFGTNMTTGPLAQQLGPSVLAIIGGYSADAVSQILQRLAETLVTIVRGSNQHEIERREREIRADASESIIREKNQIAKKLQRISGDKLDEQSPSARKNIDNLIDELLS